MTRERAHRFNSTLRNHRGNITAFSAQLNSVESTFKISLHARKFRIHCLSTQVDHESINGSGSSQLLDPRLQSHLNYSSLLEKNIV